MTCCPNIEILKLYQCTNLSALARKNRARQAAANALLLISIRSTSQKINKFVNKKDEITLVNAQKLLVLCDSFRYIRYLDVKAKCSDFIKPNFKLINDFSNVSHVSSIHFIQL